MTQKRSMTAARAGAVTLLAMAVLLGGTAIALDAVTAQLTTPVAPGWTGALPGLALAITGTILAWRLAWHPIAGTLLVFGVFFTVNGFASAWVNTAASLWPDAPLAQAAFLINQRFSGFALIAIPLVLVLFPDGTLPARGLWRAAALTSITACVLPIVALTAMPWAQLHSRFGQPDPAVARWHGGAWGVHLPSEAWEAVAAIALPAIIGGVLLSALTLLARLRGADARRRRQLKWIVWAGLVFSAIFALSHTVLPYYLGQAASILGTVVVCAAILIAVTRFRLYSIDGLLSWTLVYCILTVAIVLVDVALIALVGTALSDQVVAVAAVLIVFLVYAPLRERMLGVVSRVVNGRRGDPYGVMSALAGRLEDAVEPDDQLRHVARSIAHAFASPFVRVRVDHPGGRQLTASHGATTGPTALMPLTYRGETIGALELAPGRRPGRSPRDERLLSDVVRQAAAAVRATAMSHELQSIRERLVTAREEERHRLRRDLHDGLGPTLAGVRLRIEAARNLAVSDPARSDLLLDAALQDVTEAVTDIRRLTHDLRPPALDELGLARVVQQVCDRFIAGGLTVELRHDLPAVLPPAVEVAAYRIASEALANVQRHADADRVAVLLEVGASALTVQVADDGAGIPDHAPAGVGLGSMRERAEELGGSLTVTRRPGGGTVVRARLPLTIAEREGARA